MLFDNKYYLRLRINAYCCGIINILCEQTNNTAIKLQAKMLFDNQYLGKRRYWKWLKNILVLFFFTRLTLIFLVLRCFYDNGSKTKENQKR